MSKTSSAVNNEFKNVGVEMKLSLTEDDVFDIIIVLLLVEFL